MEEIRTLDDVDRLEQRLHESANRTVDSLKSLLLEQPPLTAFVEMRFAPIANHPIAERPLNLIEQLNQTFTCLASLRAVRWLMKRHTACEAWMLNLGTAAGVDIASRDETIVAETFAAVDPKNNDKLTHDVDRVGAKESAKFRYVFYISPSHPEHESDSPRNPQVRIISLGL